VRKVNLPSLPNWQAPKKRETIELELRLITPMFGGGYKAREVDPLQPIRPAAIRGHLRFWWRATAGARYASVADLHKAETELWGGASTKDNPAVGKVAIQVQILSAGEETPYSQIAPPSKPKDGPLHGYFLFPFQEQKKQNIPAAVGRRQVSFQLRLTLDASLSEAQRAEVRTALKAWIAFGGVGARTRRGCGALTVVGANANQWLPPTRGLAEWLEMPRDAASDHDWTTLAGARGIVVPTASPEEAWRELGQFWARFRKGHFAQAYSPMSGGKWRDYRQVLCQLRSQGNTLRLAKPFLGLPIVYQKFGKQTPFTGTLEPAESGRMASPVILKPIALQGSKYRRARVGDERARSPTGSR
jgi:CRISPR-associated protein Cmr1